MQNVYGAEDRQQEGCYSGKEQYSLPPKSQEENPSSLSSGCNCGARVASDDQLAGRGGRASQSTST